MSPNLHGLGGVVEAEADLLDLLGLGGSVRKLQLWDLHDVGGHCLGFGDHASHLDGEVGGFSKSETLCLAGVGNEEVGPQSQDSYRRRHLQHQISVVQYSHELGQSWPTKYGVVGGVEVGDIEVDVLDAVVASRGELYREGDLSKRFGGPAKYHTPKGGVGGCEI